MYSLQIGLCSILCRLGPVHFGLHKKNAGANPGLVFQTDGRAADDDGVLSPGSPIASDMQVVIEIQNQVVVVEPGQRAPDRHPVRAIHHNSLSQVVPSQILCRFDRLYFLGG